ncbi:MAG TPA: serine hydrolase domain-containing protein, partial [Feifaniaceae bacterium]|nr:serine hydrolase domain-containing protein [Feifaniaceae bacterium]
VKRGDGSMPGRDWGRLDSLLTGFVEEGRLPGCGLAVTQDGATQYEGCFGSVDAARGAFTPETPLLLHSVSKVITCVAAMQLYERGLFALDDPIKDYIPAFSNPRVAVQMYLYDRFENAARDITIRDLFTMTSGLPYPSETAGVELALCREYERLYEEERSGAVHTLSDVVELLANTPLKFQPGTDWMYGASHMVVGRLVEVLSGMRLGTYLKRFVYEPLKMEHTRFTSELPEAEQPYLTVNNGGRFEKWDKKSLILGALSIETPCAGIVSDMRDMARFSAMLSSRGAYGGARILGENTVDLMCMNALNETQLKTFNDCTWPTNRGFGYGLGMRTLLDPAKAGYNMGAGAFGWEGHCGCYLLADPAKNMSIFYAQQMAPNGIAYFAPRFLAVIAGIL